MAGISTLVCPDCTRSLEPLYIQKKAAQIALHCPGCDEKWLVTEVLTAIYLMRLYDTYKVPYLSIVKEA